MWRRSTNMTPQYPNRKQTHNLLLLSWKRRICSVCLSFNNMRKVVLVTGANSGIGLALCERLLSHYAEGLQLCLACRNMQRAEAAVSALLASHPEAQVDLVQMDTSRISSVLSAAQKVKLRYDRLDYLYLNAGIMPNPKFDMKAFFKGLFSSSVITMFATGEGILTQKDAVTPDGLQEVFATNLFGHFLLIRELEPVLCHAGQTSQLVWTSSSNAHRSAFNLDDIQHQKGTQPYSSSKYATDLLSLALNNHYNKQGLYSSVICPGFVMTNLTYGILPSFPAFLWTILLPLFWLIRIFTNTFTLSPYNGSEALFWLFKQNPESLDPYAKYHSLTSGLGNNYTQPRKMDMNLETSESFYEKLLQLESDMRKNMMDKAKESHHDHRRPAGSES